MILGFFAKVYETYINRKPEMYSFTFRSPQINTTLRSKDIGFVVNVPEF